MHFRLHNSFLQISTFFAFFSGLKYTQGHIRQFEKTPLTAVAPLLAPYAPLAYSTARAGALNSSFQKKPYFCKKILKKGLILWNCHAIMGKRVSKNTEQEV